MSQSESSELRREVRLKLVLKRGTALASVYSRPEVQQRTLQGFDELLERNPRLTAARELYLQTISDSYRVLRAAMSYAAMEFRTSEEHVDDFAAMLLPSADGGQILPAAVMNALHPSCAVLDRFAASQQRVLDRFVEVARDRGVIGMSTDPDLRGVVTRAVLPTADDYRRHVFGLLESRFEAADRIVHALETGDAKWRNPAARMRDRVEGESIAIREVLHCDTENQAKRLYSS